MKKSNENVCLNRLMSRDAVEHREPPFNVANVDHAALWFEQHASPAMRGASKSEHVVCHWEASSGYRREPFALLPQAIPDRKCTHFVYNSATIGIYINYFIDTDASVEVNKKRSFYTANFVFFFFLFYAFRSSRAHHDHSRPSL